MRLPILAWGLLLGCGSIAVLALAAAPAERKPAGPAAKTPATGGEKAKGPNITFVDEEDRKSVV
jgi:hypothetical protein